MNQRENAIASCRATLCGAMLLWMLCTTMSGCALMDETKRVYWLAKRTTQIEPRFYGYVRSDRVDQREARLLAEQAWAEYASSNFGEYTPDYENGFVEGFADYMYRGGDGIAPAIPPRGYWNLRFLNPKGKAKTKQWYDGFQAGAQDCKARGLRDMWIVPTSVLFTAGEKDEISFANDLWDEPEPAFTYEDDEEGPQRERLHREEEPPLPRLGPEDLGVDALLGLGLDDLPEGDASLDEGDRSDAVERTAPNTPDVDTESDPFPQPTRPEAEAAPGDAADDGLKILDTDAADPIVEPNDDPFSLGNDDANEGNAADGLNDVDEGGFDFGDDLLPGLDNIDDLERQADELLKDGASTHGAGENPMRSHAALPDPPLKLVFEPARLAPPNGNAATRSQSGSSSQPRVLSNADFFRVSQKATPLGASRSQPYRATANRSRPVPRNRIRAKSMHLNTPSGFVMDGLDEMPLPVLPMQLQGRTEAASRNREVANAGTWNGAGSRARELPMRITAGPIQQAGYQSQALADDALPDIVKKRSLKVVDESSDDSTVRWRIRD